MAIETVSPAEAYARYDRHTMMIDIRGEEAWRREHITGSRPVSAEHLTPDAFSHANLQATDAVIFHCQRGIRTQNLAPQLAAAVFPARALVIAGGIDAWKAAGYAVEEDRRQPLPLMRQVQICAGALTLAGTIAGAFIHPGFYVMPAFIGAGLIFAGTTGWCGMARLLAAMPWNKAVP
ncbi:rhodanese family protein [Pantoea sp.]|uniref:rhodanese family protein n=1 Tax=Pantoea sp. TaxID=69393 RepID=UPI0031D64E7C